jgi:hypothetical protein
MKTIIALFALALASTAFATAEPKKAPETKRVCKVDEKTKKEVCKTIKIHKKVEGSKVPQK